MKEYFVTSTDEPVVPIIPIVKSKYQEWLEKQSAKTKNWLKANKFQAKSGSFCLMPGSEGKLRQVYLGLNDIDDFWAFGALPSALPDGYYHIRNHGNPRRQQKNAIAWGCGCYKFIAYKNAATPNVKLVLNENFDINQLNNLLAGIFLGRDLINYPAENMGPASLAKATTSLAIEFNATVKQIIGDDLLKANCNLIHAVGRGSSCSPRLIDLRWGKSKNPKITLVGKGVCFDSGGLDLKSPKGMESMKKDMAGAAYVLALARMIMAADLPVSLRVLIPAVENMTSGSSYKPGDIVKSYKGLTVEVINTDAEGRLILADALAMASEEEPELLIDVASLTGAASLALGTDIVAMFATNNSLSKALLAYAEQEKDNLLSFPLHKPYRELLSSSIADLRNVGTSNLGGPITAALFLQEFVGKNIDWVHIDTTAMNLKDRPGRPKGGEVVGLRAIFRYLQQKYTAE